jgi:release factor glutamine methyltransferase
LPEPLTIGNARREAAGRLAEISETPDLDSELLIREVLSVDRTGLFLRERDPMPIEDQQAFEALIARRLSGEPVAYILGRKAFRSIELVVDPRVLVPRPETEQLVQIALEWIRSRPGPLRVVDVGTGSGAIALSLASELPDRDDVEIVATDVSPDALDVARVNRERLGLDRVELVESHLLEAVPGTFDLILANLPYLRPDQRHASTVHEPDLALYSGDDGFDLYRELIAFLPEQLNPGGLFVGEIDPDQAGLATGTGATIIRDLAGRDRFFVLTALACRG